MVKPSHPYSNQFLLQFNREAKARWSTKSLVLGKAKVMSSEDLEVARAKRATRGQASASKPKRGHKRKSDVLEGLTVALSSLKDTGRVTLVQQSDVTPVSAERASVAKMYPVTL
jgi:hypothetical protein